MEASAAPRYAWYGDDFTGASDTLATLAQAGLRARLFLGIPDRLRLKQAGPLDAIGIAGATRSMPPAAIESTLRPVARFFATSGVRLVHYKVCSTFDSAPHVGNIGTAITVLRAALRDPLVAIVGGQPSLGRYCAFGQLFAADAQGDVHRIDRHPTMRAHPVTPMGEADLRLHLGAQGVSPIELVDWRSLEAAAGTAVDADIASRTGGPPILFDTLDDAHVATIGRLLWRRAQQAPLLAIGASSVAQAFVDALGANRVSHVPAVARADGPVFAMAGSLSALTARQVASAVSYQRVPLDALRLVQDGRYADVTLKGIVDALRAGRNVLAHTFSPAGAPAPVDAAAGAEVAAAAARLFAAVLRQAKVARAGVAGGDTSSHAVTALAPDALGWVARLAPGVALCRAYGDEPSIDGLELMLKGGQMGGEGLFEALVHGAG